MCFVYGVNGYYNIYDANDAAEQDRIDNDLRRQKETNDWIRENKTKPGFVADIGGPVIVVVSKLKEVVKSLFDEYMTQQGLKNVMYEREFDVETFSLRWDATELELGINIRTMLCDYLQQTILDYSDASKFKIENVYQLCDPASDLMKFIKAGYFTCQPHPSSWYTNYYLIENEFQLEYYQHPTKLDDDVRELANKIFNQVIKSQEFQETVLKRINTYKEIVEKVKERAREEARLKAEEREREERQRAKNAKKLRKQQYLASLPKLSFLEKWKKTQKPAPINNPFGVLKGVVKG